ESAKAPPSVMTSFCRSWMISAVRFGSSCSDAFSAMSSSSPHERLAPRGGLRLEPVETGARADEHRAPAGAAPVEIADGLGDLDDAEVLALCAQHPDAARPRHVDVPALVALHAVDEVALLEARRPDPLGEEAPVREGAVPLDVEDPDMRVIRV